MLAARRGAPDQRRDRRPAVHLRPHRREPRLLAAAQAAGRRPPRPGRRRRDQRSAPASGRSPPPRSPRAAVAADLVRRAGGRAGGAGRSLQASTGWSPPSARAGSARPGWRCAWPPTWPTGSPTASGSSTWCRSPTRDGRAGDRRRARPRRAPGSLDEDNVLGWLADRRGAAGAGQLRAPARRRGGPAGTAARRQPTVGGARHQPGPAAGPVRVGVPGARAVASNADDGGPGTRSSCSWAGPPPAGSPVGSRRLRPHRRASAGASTAWRWPSSWPPPASPSLGLDGLEAGLADRLRLLTGGSRVDDRHRSLRSTLDWSYALLDEPDQAVLRRVSVFASPFTATTAAAVLAGWPPVPAGAVPTILAGLADQSLLVATAAPGGTRYRALETIRQYGVDRLDDAGESVEARSRHLRWCLADERRARASPSREPVGALAGRVRPGRRRAARRAGLGGRKSRAAARRRTGWPSGWPS